MNEAAKKYTEAFIREKIMNDIRWLEKGIVTIYNFQTTQEKHIEDTIMENGVGFSGAHAKRGSYYAKWLISGKNLSGFHIEKAKQLMIHYVGQLTRIANKAQ